ncbi:MAG: carbohydrate ABC transporter permease [Clostridia bacterium]|nr:carbohydrate ABC transporter permease [Clostridia bacterium]
MNRGKQMIGVKIVSYSMLIIFSLLCIIPFLIIISASLSSEGELAKFGYFIMPRGITLSAYKMVLQNPRSLIGAYKVTIFTTAVGSVMSVIISAMLAYPLSRQDYKWRNYINFFVYFTMLFSGGAVPSYILIAQYMHLRNNIWVLIIPLLVNPWNVFLMRTYFAQVNKALIEAAAIDGAGELRIFFMVVVPVSITGMATVFLMIALAFWNDWYQCLMFMTNEKILTLQYFLARVMSNIDDMLKNSASISSGVDLSSMPSETTRMAMCVFAAGPMVFVFVFFQKYFVRGISVGSVKG